MLPLKLSQSGEGAHAWIFFASPVPASFARRLGTVIITSNKPFAKWAELMSDEAVATAILDRLLHHSHVLSLKGNSYRMKDRLKAGVVSFD